MRAIVGTQIVESGSVTVLGDPPDRASLRRRVGYVTQSPSVYLDLTVRDNVRYFARAVRPSGADVAAEAIDAVGLGALRRPDSADLSGGQRGRVSLACALVGEPELLVLDEPTVGLDPVLRAELWERFADLAAAGTTLLVSSHVMDEAEHCAELLLMRDGHPARPAHPDELRAETGCESSLEHAFLSLIRTHRRRRNIMSVADLGASDRYASCGSSARDHRTVAMILLVPSLLMIAAVFPLLRRTDAARPAVAVRPGRDHHARDLAVRGDVPGHLDRDAARTQFRNPRTTAHHADGQTGPARRIRRGVFARRRGAGGSRVRGRFRVARTRPSPAASAG